MQGEVGGTSFRVEAEKECSFLGIPRERKPMAESGKDFHPYLTVRRALSRNDRGDDVWSACGSS